MKHPVLSKVLIDLAKNDLHLRDRLIREGDLNNGYHPEMEAVHVKNTAVLSQIIEEIGYPTVEKVGEKGSEAAWLIIQHSISNPGFMKKCCALLKEEVKRKKGSAINLAYLTDRILVFQDKPQQYGTQFDWDKNGQMSPNEIDDPNNVNARRKLIGLNSLEHQIESMRQQARDHHLSPPKDLEVRRKEYEAWKRRTGWIN